MQPLIETDIKESFGNASDAELAQMSLPLDFPLTEWAHLDAFAWRDPRIAARGYLRAAGANGSRHRAAICNLCHTPQPGDQVELFSARKAGPAGERGDSIGTYMCSDLGCQETVRLGRPAAPSEVIPSVREIERIEAVARRTRAFVAGVLGEA